jgi:predicted DNA-binding protein
MRTTKVIAFSVPPEFEDEIQAHAEAEHRTISEYIREAVRQYMSLRKFEVARSSIAKAIKKKGIKPTDVASEIEKVRKRS